jgi:hypothetical protein
MAADANAEHNDGSMALVVDGMEMPSTGTLAQPGLDRVLFEHTDPVLS